MGKSVSKNYIEEVLQTNPDSHFFARHAYNLLMDEKIFQAQKIAIAGIKKSPNFATGRFVLALCLMAEKDYDLALKQLYEVLKIEPTYQSALDKAIQILTMQEKNEESQTIEDFLVRLNPESHFLGKYPREIDRNDTISEILGEKLDWEIFERKKSDKQQNIPELQEKRQEEQIVNEFNIELKNENADDNIDGMGDILAELEMQGNIETPKDVFDENTMSVKDEKLNDDSETDYAKELEKFASIYDDFAESSFVDALDETTTSYPNMELEYENAPRKTGLYEIVHESPKEVTNTDNKESEFSDFKNLIAETITTLPLDNKLPPKNENKIVEKTEDTAEFSIDEIKGMVDKAKGNSGENNEKKPNALIETTEFSMNEIQQMMLNAKEVNENDDTITGTDIDNALDNFFKEEQVVQENAHDYSATILENANQKLNEEEQKAEPISEKEAFADMLAKNGADLLPNHILTPTFAQIYLEQEQPFLAKQIYERLLERDGENDEYLEKLSEVNKVIEMMKNGESVLVEPKILKREKPKTDIIPTIPKKSLKGKRIKKEIREALKEKHSANSKESTENNDDKI